VAPARLDDELNGAGRNPLERPSAPIDGATADACFEGFEGSESVESDEPSALFSLSLSLRREIDFAILALSVGIASGTRRRHGPCEDPRRAVPQLPSPGDE
jgi:hypothetical protein